MPGRAIIEITKRGREGETRESGLIVYRSMENRAYQVELDWEIGTVLALGEGDWEPVTVGDTVMIRAESGGAAGSDIGSVLGRGKNQVVVVRPEEIVCMVS